MSWARAGVVGLLLILGSGSGCKVDPAGNPAYKGCSTTAPCSGGAECYKGFCLPPAADGGTTGPMVDGGPGAGDCLTGGKKLGDPCIVPMQMGSCANGQLGCSGMDTVCNQVHTQKAEICNGMDDDCDGIVDDGYDLLHDKQNCGACGKECSPAESCCGGNCVDLLMSDENCGMCGRRCGGGLHCCGGQCVDEQTSNDHCGDCATSCGTGGVRTCCSGHCVNTATAASSCGTCGSICSGDGQLCCAGKCIDTKTSTSFCGDCQHHCNGSDQCCNGMCGASCVMNCPGGCTGSTTCCGTACKDTHTDPANCGTCGHACGAHHVCCPIGLNGQGVCVPEDNNHCGRTCITCPMNQLCCGGSCAAQNSQHCDSCTPCGSGTDCCGGSCTMLGTIDHCAACNDPCMGGASCMNGMCCGAGLHYCADVNACVDFTMDTNHCGDCMTKCGVIFPGLLSTCANGTCKLL